MTFKMDRKEEEMKVTTDCLSQAASDVFSSKTVDRDPDASQMIRERNLLLLSVLYYLYGEEWKESPDWNQVSLTIQSKKIVHYGDDFTPEYCEKRYKSLMENGYEVGIGPITTTLRVPKRLTEAQKRLWILASTSTDIVRTSRILDEQMRSVYKEEMAKIDKIDVGEYKMDPTEIELEDDIVPLEGEDEFQFESTELEKQAADLVQLETTQKIVGFHDALSLIKYCYDAAGYAVKKQSSLMSSQKKSESSLTDIDKTIDTTKSLDATQGSSNVTSSVISVTLNEKTNETTQLAASNIVSTPSESSTVKETTKHDSSPQKISKPATRGSSRDRTLVESAAKKETVTNIDSTAKTGSARNSKETNGNDHTTASNKTSTDDDKVEIKTEPENAKGTTDGNDSENKNEANDKPKLDITEKSIEFKLMDSVPVDSSQSSTIEITFEPEAAPKGKKPTAKKGSSSTPSATSPASSRTSSRLASPEPDNESDKQRKSLSRQHSGSDNASAVGRRSRRGTPTKASSVERDTKDSAAETTLHTKPLEDIEEDSLETPRTTPESPEAKSDIETIENRPKQPKVYTVKPPSPLLSHFDPKLFDLNDEDEDEELAAIDESVNKSRNEKSSSTKTFAKRGRTASSENASGDGSGNTEDSAKKRHTRSKLTRSSLRLWDAENDDGENVPKTESEKAASESSFSEKDKKPRQSKTQMRARRLFDEKQRLYGESDLEETLEGTRVTRARAKTSTSTSESRSKSSTRGESESAGDAESTTARATRSRVSTSGHTSLVDSNTSQILLVDEDDKVFRKHALSLLEKLIGHDSAIAIQKYINEDPSKVIKHQIDFQTIKQKVESGKIKNIPSLKKDLSLLVLNMILAHPTSTSIKEASITFYKWFKTWSEDLKNTRNLTLHKADNSDVESLESHESSRDAASKPSSSAGGRRKRKRSASETSEDLSSENKRRVTRTSVSSYQQQTIRKPKHPISPDIVSANRVRH